MYVSQTDETCLGSAGFHRLGRRKAGTSRLRPSLCSVLQSFLCAILHPVLPSVLQPDVYSVLHPVPVFPDTTFVLPDSGLPPNLWGLWRRWLLSLFRWRRWLPPAYRTRLILHFRQTFLHCFTDQPPLRWLVFFGKIIKPEQRSFLLRSEHPQSQAVQKRA
jgi:hypothetical protein